MVAIGKLKPYWRNPRKRSEDSIRKIAASIKAYGWRQPIVVDREFVVVIGHGRLEAATMLKAKRASAATNRLKPSCWALMAARATAARRNAQKKK